MKGLKITYWVVTVLFAAFMIFTAIPNITSNADSVKLIHTDLGFPLHFIPFIGVAKLVGSLVILIPGLLRIKEWAYAGLFFDLSGAAYSAIATWGFDPSMIIMFVFCGFCLASYFLYHRYEKMKLADVRS